MTEVGTDPVFVVLRYLKNKKKIKLSLQKKHEAKISESPTKIKPDNKQNWMVFHAVKNKSHSFLWTAKLPTNN